MQSKIKNLNICPIVVSLILATFCLSKCIKKNEESISERQISTIKESFYDENYTGIDDAFERLPNSEENIYLLQRIEKMIKINNRINELHLDFEYTNNPSSNNKDIDLNKVEEILNILENDNEISSNERENYIQQLTEYYKIISNKLIYQAHNVLADNSLKLAKTILLDTTEYNGDISNFRIYNFYRPYNLPWQSNIGHAEYSNEGLFNKIYYDSSSSNIYYLVDVYVSNIWKKPQDIKTKEEYNERIKLYEKSIKIIAETLNNNYEIEENNEEIKIISKNNI